MKKTLLMLLAVASTTVAFAQKGVVKFTKAEQMAVQKILGKDYTAVLGKDGQMTIVTPDRVGQLKSTAKGGFTGKPSAAASIVLASNDKYAMFKPSTSVLKSKLGKERFNQLNSILESKVPR